MLSAQVRQMRSFLVVRQVFANAVDHHHYESAIIHIEPVGAAHEFIGAVSDEWAVDILAQVRLVKPRHDLNLTFRLLGLLPASAPTVLA